MENPIYVKGVKQLHYDSQEEAEDAIAGDSVTHEREQVYDEGDECIGILEADGDSWRWHSRSKLFVPGAGKTEAISAMATETIFGSATDDDINVRMNVNGNVNGFMLDWGLGFAAFGVAPTTAALEIANTDGALRVPRMTTAQRNVITPVNGDILYNSTTNKFEGYEAGGWANLI